MRTGSCRRAACRPPCPEDPARRTLPCTGRLFRQWLRASGGRTEGPFPDPPVRMPARDDSSGGPRPGCCTTVIYSTRPFTDCGQLPQTLYRMSAITVACTPRTVARLARSGKSVQPYRPHRGRGSNVPQSRTLACARPASMPLSGCSNAVLQYPLSYCGQLAAFLPGPSWNRPLGSGPHD